MYLLKYVLVEMSNCIACLDSLKELLKQLLGQPNATIVCVAETYFKRTWWKRSEASLDTNNRKFRDSFFPVPFSTQNPLFERIVLHIIDGFFLTFVEALQDRNFSHTHFWCRPKTFQ